MREPLQIIGVAEFAAPKVRWAVFAVLAFLSLAVRLPNLAERPMHTDEAVNAYITGSLLAGEPFRYDSQDRHGPVLHLLAAPLARFCGAKDFASLTEEQLRLTPVIVGAGTVLLCGAAVEWVGFGAAIVAAILLAFGPLPVYYNRYFIHETPFVAATLWLVLAGARAVKTNSMVHSISAGLAAAFMLACKETSVLHFAALAAAALTFGSISRIRAPVARLLLVAGVAFVIATILLFTWGGRNWNAVSDLLRGGPNWATRAGGQGHEKPFWYYIALLAGGYSGLIFMALAVVGIVISISTAVRRKRTSPQLFISCYAIFVTAIYSAIPYKTPWLELNLWLPFSFLVGIAWVRIWNGIQPALRVSLAPPAGIAIVVLMALDVQSRVFTGPADERNPYAYAHTSEDLLRLPVRLRQLAAAHGLTEPRIAVVAADPWPLPWYLRTFPQVGFWKPGQDTGAADFFVTSPEAAEMLRDQLKNLRPEYFGLRPEVIVVLWTRDDSRIPHG